MNITITIKGLDEAVAKLERLGIAKALEPAMYKAVLRLEARMKDYPAPPRLSRYIRTGTLGRRWTHEVTRSGNAIRGKVGNNASYGPWVQSKRFQTRVHRNTGWITDEQAIQEETQNIVRDFEQAIREALR